MKQVFLILLAVLTLSSCSDDDDAIGDNQQTDNAVRLSNDATFGNILTDAEGNTLYFFSTDATGDSTCFDGCLDAWPVFYAEDLTLDSGLDATDFGTITRTDGTMQTTYKGWPLYYFANDAQAGDVNGDGVANVWYVAKPDYTVMITRAQLVGRDSDGNETNLNSNFQPGDEETFYITDDYGNTLYGFVVDTNNQNNFTAEDFSNNAVWPIFETEFVNAPSILNGDDFDVIDVHGRQQLTYKGWPLYFFQQDMQRGDNYGVGFPSAGVWPTLNQDSEVLANSAVRLRNDATFGNILTDADGNTLYFFSDDYTGDTSECEGGCLDAWPIFYAENLTLDNGLDADDFGTVQHPNGQMMTTYKGWPLYYFANDAEAGEVNGDGVADVWYVAKPDYTVMYVRAQLVGRDSDNNETNLIVDGSGNYVSGTGETFYITDDYGNTLYGFVNDTNNDNNFTAEDFSNNAVWPIYETALVNAPSILNSDDFDVIDVFGRQQLTYKGWPLYFFQQDEERGDNYGVGFPSAGIWPILNQNSNVLP